MLWQIRGSHLVASHPTVQTILFHTERLVTSTCGLGRFSHVLASKLSADQSGISHFAHVLVLCFVVLLENGVVSLNLNETSQSSTRQFSPLHSIVRPLFYRPDSLLNTKFLSQTPKETIMFPRAIVAKSGANISPSTFQERKASLRMSICFVC